MRGDAVLDPESRRLAHLRVDLKGCNEELDQLHYRWEFVLTRVVIEFLLHAHALIRRPSSRAGIWPSGKGQSRSVTSDTCNGEVQDVILSWGVDIEVEESRARTETRA